MFTFAVTVTNDKDYRLAFLIAAVVCGCLALYAKSSATYFDKEEKERKELDTRTRAAKIAEALLEAMHRGHFRNGGDEETHKNRVTLFVCNEPTAGQPRHLAIFARCGVHRSSTTRWVLSDDHPDGCRGTAGKAWYHEAALIKRTDCDWPQSEDEDTDGKQRSRYAEGLGITVEEAAALKVKSRAVIAAPVMVNGRKWGVLVLDTLVDDVIPQQPAKLREFKAMFNHYAELIGRTLGEAGV
jgi:hypothetical protein